MVLELDLGAQSFSLTEQGMRPSKPALGFRGNRTHCRQVWHCLDKPTDLRVQSFGRQRIAAHCFLVASARSASVIFTRANRPAPDGGCQGPIRAWRRATAVTGTLRSAGTLPPGVQVSTRKVK